MRFLKPSIDKPFLAELGSINPMIVVPGDWSARDLQHHTPAIIATKMHTNAHICTTPQVVITSADWKHREAFVQVIKKEIEASKHHAHHDGHYRRGAGP